MNAISRYSYTPMLQRSGQFARLNQINGASKFRFCEGIEVNV